MIIDRRSFAHPVHDRGPRDRPPTGICLHQTACLLGERQGRWDSVGAHVGVTRAGVILWLHDFDRIVWHGNGWNAGTIGIEIDGLYAGIGGDPSTVWDDPSTPKREAALKPTDKQLAAAQTAIRWICGMVPTIRALVAHRQSSESRRNDPGSEIWNGVALPMHAELGLSDGGVGFKLGTGRAIPEAWDPRCKGVKY